MGARHMLHREKLWIRHQMTEMQHQNDDGHFIIILMLHFSQMKEKKMLIGDLGMEIVCEGIHQSGN